MKVTVKKLLGRECVVDIMPSETVLQLKEKVSDLMGIDVPQQRLLLTGRTLADEHPLSFYPGIKDGSKLNLLVIKKAEEGSSDEKGPQTKSGTHPLKDEGPQTKPGTRLLKDEISRVLRDYYTESDTETIVNELINDLKTRVNSLNFDELERLATALLQDQENIA